jgi:flavin-dependent dehydrogenase
MEPYVDAVVVGARCGGAALAGLLGQAGLEVLVLDRSRRGSDKLSTLYIHQPGVRHLRDWGLVDGDLLAGAPAVRQLRYHAEDIVVVGPGPVVGGDNAAFAPRRKDLDELLCLRAERNGATVLHEARISGLLRDRGRVSGVSYSRRGHTHEVRARLVIGADGMRSTIADAVGAQRYLERPKLTCCYYGYFEGLEDSFAQYQRRRRWVGVIPTESHHLVACYLPQEEFLQAKQDPEAAFAQTLDVIDAGLAARVAGATRSGRLIGMGDQQNFFREAAGPGWVLVGDAGHHKDSLTARGITDAFTQASLLAEELLSLDSTDAAELDAATGRFAKRRDEILTPHYFSTLAVARLDLTPARRQMLEAIAGQADLCELYASAMAGVIEPDQFHEALRLRGVAIGE